MRDNKVSFEDLQRQLRLGLIAILIIVPIGVLGFMAIEQRTFLDALWLTITTLSTIGYGDFVANTEAGRVFTLVLIIFGLSSFAFAIQAAYGFFVSPAIRDLRQRRAIQRQIDTLMYHYVICGKGEMVDKTISYILQRAESRRLYQREQLYRPLDRFLDRLLGDDEDGHFLRFRRFLHNVFLVFVRNFYDADTILDVIVVVTDDSDYANHLRNAGVLVTEGDPTSDDILRQAGIIRAQAMMVMLDSDTEALLTVLTAHNMNPNLYITAATLDSGLKQKMVRVGANNAIAPYDVAGQFLNSATLRPTVNDFFRSILFESENSFHITELYLWDDSHWIGQRLNKLELRDRFQAGVVALRKEDGHFIYSPTDDYILQEGEIVLAIAPARFIQPLQEECRRGAETKPKIMAWQKLPPLTTKLTGSRVYSLEEAEATVSQMSQHFVICGTGQVARNTVDKLNPDRPFVIISDDDKQTAELLERGFRVIHGNPTQEIVLKKAGVDRALAIMVTLEEKADSVLCVITCRGLSKRLLISATAMTDDMLPKLYRAGADRVVSPFHIAAQFVLLATTRPDVNDFMQYVLFNYESGLETTEIYMETTSPWIGETIESLRIDRLFQAGVIGIRLADGKTFIYAPSGSHVISPNEVLIIVTPMAYSDELMLTAHGSVAKRPLTLRRGDVMKSRSWTVEELEAMMKQN